MLAPEERLRTKRRRPDRAINARSLYSGLLRVNGANITECGSLQLKRQISGTLVARSSGDHVSISSTEITVRVRPTGWKRSTSWPVQNLFARNDSRKQSGLVNTSQ